MKLFTDSWQEAGGKARSEWRGVRSEFEAEAAREGGREGRGGGAGLGGEE